MPLKSDPLKQCFMSCITLHLLKLPFNDYMSLDVRQSGKTPLGVKLSSFSSKYGGVLYAQDVTN